MNSHIWTRVSALAFAAVLFGTAAGFAQPASPTDEDHGAHHPPAASGAPSAPDKPGETPKGMMGQDRGGMMGGDMHQMMSMMRNMMNMMRAQGDAMGDGGMEYGMMGWTGPGHGMCGRMASHIEGRLAFIKAELKITQDQEPLWNAYATAARDNAKTMLARCTTMMGKRADAGVGLPDRLDQHEQLMAARLEAVRAMNSALKPLYAALSDEQKQTADKLFWGPMCMM